MLQKKKKGKQPLKSAMLSRLVSVETEAFLTASTQYQVPPIKGNNPDHLGPDILSITRKLTINLSKS